MSSNIKIKCFKGKAIDPYLKSIARIRCEIYREYPYLLEKDLEDEMNYLENHFLGDEAIAVIVFEGSTVVGVATGVPLEIEAPIILAPFLASHLDPATFYYFGKSFLLKPYRGRGILHHFFDLREFHAKSLEKFKHVCFSAISRPDNHPLKPIEYLSLDNFWKKRGYKLHSDLHYSLAWKDMNTLEASEKYMVFWSKELTS